MHSAESSWESILTSSKLLRALLLQGNHEELAVFRGKEEKGWMLGWPNFGWVGIQTAQANISLLIPFAVFLLFSYSVPHLCRHHPSQPVRWAGTLLVRSCYPQPMGLVPICESPGKIRFLHQVISVYSNWIMGTPALSSLFLCSALCSQGQAFSHIT